MGIQEPVTWYSLCRFRCDKAVERVDTGITSRITVRKPRNRREDERNVEEELKARQ